MKSKSPLEKVTNLISLALDSNAGPEEARSAAMSAVALIHKHNLLISSVAIPRVRIGSPNTSHKIQKLAEETVNQVISELVRKSILGDYPKLQASQIMDDAFSTGVITEGQKEVFYKCLHNILRAKVRRGVLISQTGWHGGYQLAKRTR